MPEFLESVPANLPLYGTDSISELGTIQTTCMYCGPVPAEASSTICQSHWQEHFGHVTEDAIPSTNTEVCVEDPFFKPLRKKANHQTLSDEARAQRDARVAARVAALEATGMLLYHAT